MMKKIIKLLWTTAMLMSMVGYKTEVEAPQRVDSYEVHGEYHEGVLFGSVWIAEAELCGGEMYGYTATPEEHEALLEKDPSFKEEGGWSKVIVEMDGVFTEDTDDDKVVSIRPYVEHQRYYVEDCRYYISGSVVLPDGSSYGYQTDEVSEVAVYDGMPVWCGFDDNGTPNEPKDDIVLGLVFDREVAIYDALYDSFSEVEDWVVTREDVNRIHIDVE